MKTNSDKGMLHQYIEILLAFILTWVSAFLLSLFVLFVVIVFSNPHKKTTND